MTADFVTARLRMENADRASIAGRSFNVVRVAVQFAQ